LKILWPVLSLDDVCFERPMQNDNVRGSSNWLRGVTGRMLRCVTGRKWT